MFAIIAAAAAAASTNPTIIDAPRSINVDGVRATYSRRVDADGTTHLKGRYRDADNLRFHYRVRGDLVEGRIGGTNVRFKVRGR